MKKSKRFDDILTGIYAFVFCSYCIVLLINVCNMLVKLVKSENDMLFSGISDIIVWIGVIIAAVYTIGLCVSAVLGVVQFKAALNVLLVLLAILELIILFLIGGMDFTTGTIMHGFDTMLVISSEVGWAIYANFYIILLVFASVTAYSKRRYGN